MVSIITIGVFAFLLLQYRAGILATAVFPFFGMGTGYFITGWVFGIVLGKGRGRVSLIC